MKNELAILMITAASIGFLHTLFGPDHYVPFVVMAKARKWSLVKTGWITLLCGLSHIFSSVLIGLAGIALGLTVSKLNVIESFRGGLAAWMLLAFGFVYFIWGIHRALKNRPHTHWHAHSEKTKHLHTHKHDNDHLHIHNEDGKNITPWILFTIFLFGPCEPLIPLLMYPAAKSSYWGLLLVTGIFGSVTIITMLSIVIISSWGINFLPIRKLERFTHALAGGAVLLCGMAIIFLGL
jgi:sulfite exporter TauE/SafE